MRGFALRRSELEGIKAVPGPWPVSRQSVPGRDRRFRAFTVSSLTGSVFQPTWVVSAMPGGRLQRFWRSSTQPPESGMPLLGKTGSQRYNHHPIGMVSHPLKNCVGHSKIAVTNDLHSSGDPLASCLKEISSDAYHRELERLQRRCPHEQRPDAGQAPRFAADQQSQRHAHDGRP